MALTKQAGSTITVHGQSHDVQAAPDTPLLYVWRHDLHLNAPSSAAGSQCAAPARCGWTEKRCARASTP
jgi:aerobic-type carbon monoxide dehydrogenase small subunit (CoxS/CutS family)